MKIPTELKHKQVIISEDYDLIDGRYTNNSDVTRIIIRSCSME